MQNKSKSIFSERLRNAMKDLGIRQTELCEKTGIGKSAMSQYINGAFIPKQERLHAIAEALNVSEGWLMGYENRSCIEFFSPDDSMLGANIPKGSKILLKENDRFLDWDPLINGKIVCISVKNSEPKLRYIYRVNDMIVLNASNKQILPELFDISELRDGSIIIHGIVNKVEIKI